MRKPPSKEKTYRRFTEQMRLSDILHANYLLLPVVRRFGIHYGVGDRTVAQICEERAIDARFFIEVLNVYHDANYFPEAELRKSDIRHVVEYLIRTHDYYRDYLLPTIGGLIDRFVASGEPGNSSLRGVASLFNEFSREFHHHMEVEEEHVFPHALDVAARFALRTPLAEGVTRSHRSLREVEREHHGMDEKLLDLKNLLIKYITGPFEIHLCNAIIFELDRLERDTSDHGRMEDRILHAVVTRMEARLRPTRN